MAAATGAMIAEACFLDATRADNARFNGPTCMPEAQPRRHTSAHETIDDLVGRILIPIRERLTIETARATKR